jgi:glc operon protein GlcG
MRTIPTIDYAEAKRAVDLIVEKALELQAAVVVAVADCRGEVIAFARMDGAPVSSVTIAMNKAWTAVRTGKPTREIGERVRDPQKGHDISYYGDARFVGWGGGIPVRRNGEVAGAVAVSGLSSSEDATLATLGVESIDS